MSTPLLPSKSRAKGWSWTGRRLPPGTCWGCHQDTLVCAGSTLQAPGETQGTCHAICDDCIARARRPHHRAALRAALDQRPA